MFSTLLMKSYHDLEKRKARSVFTMLTIMLGVMGMALFAVNPLAGETIDDEVSEQNLYNLRYSFPDTEIEDEDIVDLLSIEGVNDVQTTYVYNTDIVTKSGREDARIVGIGNPENMKVDRVIRVSGSFPDAGQVMTERWNEKNGIFEGGTGSSVILMDKDGNEEHFVVSGTGKSLAHSEGTYDSSGEAVFYTEISTVHNMSGSSGVNMLSVDLASTSGNDIEEAISSIWMVMSGVDGLEALEESPEIREEGEWPGGEFLDMFMTIMYVLTIIAVICSVFFIYNTMNTMITEQRREIAIMKALGATKARIFRSFITTSLLMGGIGAAAGTLLGTFLTYILLVYFGGLLGFDAVFTIHLQTVLISLLGGMVLVGLSSLPAIFKGLSVSTREGLEDTGISSKYGKGIVDRILVRTGWLPRTVQLGLRNSSRRKGRSIATILQVSLAVGVFLGLVSFGYSIGVELTKTIDNLDYDLILDPDEEGDFLPSGIRNNISVIDGVERVEPFIETRFSTGGMEVYVMGYQPDTSVKLHDKTMVKGEWFNTGNVGERVAVIGEQLAEYSSISVGDMLPMMTPTGPVDIEIIGIDSDFYYMGMILYMPLSTVQDLTGQIENVSGFHIKTSDGSRTFVDRTAMSLEDELNSYGFDVETDKKYSIVEGTVSQNRSIINMMAATSIIIILISLVGLTSNLTMNIMDRTREIGVMRCIGSVASGIRTIFTTEVITLSILGWALGIPIGFLMARTVSMVIYSMIDWEIRVHYPLSYVVTGFFLVVIGAVIVAQLPIMRATRIRPGDALRYQ